jgi:uncharacterized protein (DUF1697 family)
MRYVALLRAINASEHSRVRMADLRSCLEQAGMKVVATYLQSGNVILEEASSESADLAERIEDALKGGFGVDTAVVVLTDKQLESIVDAAPDEWREPHPRGKNDRVERQIVFLVPPLTPKAVLRDLEPDPEVEFLEAGKLVLYWAVPPKRLKDSVLSGLSGTAAYQCMTMRAFTTVKGLFELSQKH